MNQTLKKCLVLLQLKEHCLVNKLPEYLVRLNGESIYSSANHLYELNCNFGPNEIQIELRNKDDFDTTVVNGEVTHDLAIEVISIISDKIDLTYQLKPYAKINGEIKNVEIKNSFYIGKNSTLSFPIICKCESHI